MTKTRAYFLLTAVVLAVTTLAFAQGRGNGPGPGVPAVDPTAAVTLEGPAVAFTGGFGAGLPTLTLDDPAFGVVAVRLGPFWILQDADFTAGEGDLVRLEALPCPFCPVDYVAAKVENLTTGVTVTLRDEDGRPLWLGSGGAGPALSGADRRGPGGHGPLGPGGAPWRGSAPCGGGVDIEAAITATGTVVSFTGAPGERFPILVLTLAGDEVALMAGPFRTWIVAGFEPVAGEELTVTYAPSLADPEHLVLLTATDPVSGLTVVLRDPETGFPGAGCCRR